jgi:hypothetical protein
MNIYETHSPFFWEINEVKSDSSISFLLFYISSEKVSSKRVVYYNRKKWTEIIGLNSDCICDEAKK